MKSHAFLRGVVRGLQYVTITVSPLVMSGCHIQEGPFIPQNPTVCGSDAECPEGMECKFPGVNTKAICMPRDEVKKPKAAAK